MGKKWAVFEIAKIETSCGYRWKAIKQLLTADCLSYEAYISFPRISLPQVTFHFLQKIYKSFKNVAAAGSWNTSESERKPFQAML